MLWVASSYGQSSVTLYGLMDAGITYTNNVESGKTHGADLQFTSGSAQGDRWGLRGAEDLGDQEKIIFVLENGFQLSNGALGQGGLEFGRQAYVGGAGPWGTLTLGRQFDFIGDQMFAYAIGANTPAGLLAWSLPAYAAGGYSLDNRVWGDQVNNAVKYMSPVVAGFSAGAMFGFGNTPGSIAASSSQAYIVNYRQGSFSASLAYFGQHDVKTGGNSREFAGGASYEIGAAKMFAMLTDVRLTGGDQARATTAEAGMTYRLTPALMLGGGAQFQKRNNGLGSANQLTLVSDYSLSKSTDVYVIAALAHDHAFGAQVQAALGSPSGSDVQTGARIGIRHRF
ncbi:porin [Paraburkholderia sp. Ac-20336]|nr:porin [Paraburkholderia sp. Ac-20336]MBN3846918.1 porin [Paraburkholderia sp. Ac-20342]NIF53841.1 porin [Burkholderia sp. Ax-1724]NIF77651.1 porin [Paraburkholderia sp. Cy-641]